MRPTALEIIDLPALNLRAEVGTVDQEKRTVELVFSTGAAVDRYDFWSGKRYREVLSMKPEHIRLERINAGGPLLDSHSAFSVGDVLGTVVPGSARIEKGKAIATVQFSKRPSVDDLWRDVVDGIIRNVSVGYRVHKFEEDASKDNKVPTRTAIDWEPFEISMVPMPADAGARVRNNSGDKSDTNACVIVRAQEDVTMGDENKTQETAQPEQTRTAPPVDETAVRAAAVNEERARAKGIRDAVRVAKLEATVAEDMISRGITLDAARAEIFARLAEQSEAQPTVSQVRMGEDATDKMRRGVMHWLLIRSGMAALVAKHEGIAVETIDAGEFRGMSLLDIAKETLTRAGVSFRGLDRMNVAGLAMAHRSNYQTTSDFAIVLENTLHKVLQAAYAVAPDTWSRFCGTATVADFRAQNWYRTGALSNLEDLNEHGEFKNKAIPDGEKASFSVSTKGNIIAITRQVIVNDDIGAVMRLTQGLGRAGKRTIEAAVYSLLGQNSGLGPTQSDAQPLFHSNRANVGTGAAMSVDAIEADRVLMASQKEPSGIDYLDIRPSILLVPTGLAGKAKEINAQEYNDESSKNQRRPNVVRGLFRDVVDTPRLSGTRRYLFADPSDAPVFIVSFLEGQREPVLETENGWRMDGVEMKARLDFGVAAVDYRGAVTNAGV